MDQHLVFESDPLDVKKKELEVEKLQKEIRQLDRPFKWSPAMLPALLSCLTAFAVVMTGILSGWFSNQNSLIELRNEKLKHTQDSLVQLTNATRRSLDSVKLVTRLESIRSQQELITAHAAIAQLESDKADLANQILSDSRIREVARNASAVIVSGYEPKTEFVRNANAGIVSGYVPKTEIEVPEDQTFMLVKGVVERKGTGEKLAGFVLKDLGNPSNTTVTDKEGKYSLVLHPCSTDTMNGKAYPFKVQLVVSSKQTSTQALSYHKGYAYGGINFSIIPE